LNDDDANYILTSVFEDDKKRGDDYVCKNFKFMIYYLDLCVCHEYTYKYIYYNIFFFLHFYRKHVSKALLIMFPLKKIIFDNFEIV